MTWAITHPRKNHRLHRAEVVVPRAGTRAFVRPIGVTGIGFLTVVFAAWGGICVFVGPEFGYKPTSAQSWQWTEQNWLLHLVPGAVGVVAGLMMLAMVSSRGARRGALGFAALLAIAAGTWFVIGPAAWGMFHSSAPFAQTNSANTDFLNQLGANLGPGLLLAILGGMALKAGIAKPRVMLDDAAMAPVEPVGTTANTGYVPGDAAVPAEPVMTRTPTATGATPVVDGTGSAPVTRTETTTGSGSQGMMAPPSSPV